MFERLLELLKFRGVDIGFPVNLDKVSVCVLEELTIKEVLSVVDDVRFTKMCDLSLSNIQKLCRVLVDMGGDMEVVFNVLSKYEDSLKKFIFRFIVSPQTTNPNELLILHLSIEEELL